MQWQICRAETLPVRYQDPDLLSQNRILIVSSFFSRCCKSFVLDGSDRPYVIFPFGPPCEFSVFSVLTVLMCELKKNKKWLSIFKKSMFPPYQLHVIFPYALYMADFLFYRSQVERETFCSSFSSLNSYMYRFLRHSKLHNCHDSGDLDISNRRVI